MQNFKKDQQIPLVLVTDPNTGQTYYAPQNVVYDEKNNNGPQYLRNVIVDQATTASYFSGSIANAVSASYALTASYVAGLPTSSISASYAVSASYAANGGVTQLLAGPNISLSPTNGLGQVTVSATLSGSTIFNTATGSYGSFYDTTTQTNPVANIARSMSLNSTDITNGVSISGSTNPFNTYIKTENAGIYNIQFSAQVDKTDGGTDDVVIWLRKNGIDLTDTATTLTLPTNNSKVVAAWNWFVTSANGDYYQIIWRSADTDLRLLAEPITANHPGIPSVIVTVNRVDQFLSNTGSFSGSFTGALTGSFSGSGTITSASYAATASLAPLYLPLAGGTISGDVTVLGTASINTLIVNQIGYSSGSNQLGDAANDTQTLFGTVRIPTGSLTVTGSQAIYNPASSISGLSIVSPQTSAGSLVLSTIGTPGINNGAYFIMRHSDGTFPTPSLTGTGRIISTQVSQYFSGSSYFNATSVLDVSDGIKIFGATPSYGGTLTYYGKLDKGNWYFGDLSSTINTARDQAVSARVQIKGSGATSSTTALLVQNANASASLQVYDDRTVYFPAGNLSYGAPSGSPLKLNITQPTGTSTYAGVNIGHLNTAVTSNVTVVGGRNTMNDSGHFIFGHQNNISAASFALIFGAGNAQTVNSGTHIIIGNSNTSNAFTNTENASIIIGQGNSTNGFYGGGLFGSNIRYYANSQLAFGGNSNNVNFALSEIYFGNGVRNEWTSGNSNNGHGPNISINTSQAYSGSLALDRNGGNITLRGGQGTGTGSAGDVIFATAVTGSSGATYHSYTNRVWVKGHTGNVGIGISTPSASLHISGASSNVLLEIDSPTVNNILYVSGSGNVGIGTGIPTSRLTVSGAAGTNSAIYAYKSGSTVLDIQGSQGQLFSVIDALSGSLMSVNDVSGLPILEVFSDDRVVMGTYGAPALTVTGSTLRATGSLLGTASYATTALSASYAPDTTFPYTGNAIISGSLTVTGSLIVSGSSTLVNVGPAIFSGSITQTASTASFRGLVGIGTTTPAYKLDVSGSDASINGRIVGRGTNSMSRTTILGDVAGNAITTGDYNVFIGTNNGGINTTGYANTFVGDYAGNANTTGINNTFLGQYAGGSNSIGNRNTMVGAATGIAVTSNDNTLIGESSGRNTSTGYSNTSIGSSALTSNTTGTGNVAIGNTALYTSINTDYNIAVGYNALYHLATGSRNLALGLSAGQILADGVSNLTNATYSIFLGDTSKALGNGQTNQIVIGYNANGLGSNTVVLGNDSIVTTALKGNVGVGTTSPTSKLQVKGSGTTSATTALRVENANASASLIVLDDRSATFYNGLTITGSATVTGSVLTPTVFSDFLVSRNSILGNTNVRSIKPLSIGTTAGFSTSNTGSIRIVTPGRGNNHMIKYIFDVYSYGSTETTVETWGYDNGTWFGATAKSSNPNILVRFAYDNTGKAVIYIGSYTQNWGTYAPSIVVREIEFLGWQGNIATSASLYYDSANYQFSMVSSSGTDTINSTITNTGYNVLSAFTASFINSASTNAFVQGGNSFGTTALLGTNDNQSLAFETSGSTRVFISSSGNVGIGTGTPSQTLDEWKCRDWNRYTIPNIRCSRKH